jgi:hypothetical protein
MSSEKLTDWAGRMALKNAHLNEPNTVLRKLLREPGIGEADMGKAGRRLRVPPLLMLGVVVASGPAAQPDYADERYWVRLARPKPAADDTVAIDYEVIADATMPKPDGTTFTYKPIFTVSNPGERLSHAHAIGVGTPVLFAGFPDGHQPVENLRYVMLGGAGGESAPEFDGDVHRGTANGVSGWAPPSITNYTP